MNISLKKTLIISFVLELMYFNLFLVAEPGLVIADTASDAVVFSQVVTGGIAITHPNDVTMTPLSLAQNTAVASTTWTVTTNNASGYSLKVAADQAGALRSISAAFTDYSGPAIPWTVVDDYQFGFSAIGTHTTGYGTDPQSNCAAGSDVPSTTLGWRGFNGVTQIEIASSSSATAGTATTLCVADEQNGVSMAPSGTYYATTTATAITNP